MGVFKMAGVSWHHSFLVGNGESMTIYTLSTTRGVLYYTIERTVLGDCLIVANSKGIDRLYLGDDAVQLKEDFLMEETAILTSLEVNEVDSPLEPYEGWFAKALAELNDNDDIAKPVSSARPLSIQGTDFQQAVWWALLSIPYGETRTYSDIAQQIGRPTAVRAVASACGANKLAVLIPCHRVIGKNGALRGYRWGVERKAALLKRELSSA